MSLSQAKAASAAVAILSIVALASCGSEPPATGIDLETPVIELSGWPELTGDLELSEPEQTKLSRWVRVFRSGLDIARRGEPAAERQDLESQWWDEADRSLAVIVGPARVERVVTWLEDAFERRGGER